MMKALPAGTDSLFILNYNYITSLTPFMNIWNNLAGGLLPEKSIPQLLGMASSGGVLNSLMFTFESPTSIGALFPAHEYINRYIYQKTEIVKFDNGLDAFMYDGMLVVVMMGTAENFLKEASDPSSSMYQNPVFKPVMRISMDGAMTYITQSANVTGLPVVLSVSLGRQEESAESLPLTAWIDYGDEEKANAVENTIETYLTNIWALNNIETKQHGSVYSVKAALLPDDIQKFLEGITREN